ncbi:hypothetical protein Q4Q35_00410 [Flavivirga aquimarina]|uniref:DUF4374 domain-containing protein n=1 Tax=Flavivirga aquimarina TaxID=2027862 RepID=A0ABT8W574_9FLAO|nr:hypothetical protein [Flavivirga aquimarina]MDO5968256.1 hypothetical protein [Flavivirga aquimarina]
MNLYFKQFKNNTLSILLIAMSFLITTSCKNDDDNVDEPEEEIRLKTGFVINATTPNDDFIVKYFEELPSGVANLTDGQVFTSFTPNEFYDGYFFDSNGLDETDRLAKIFVNIDGELEEDEASIAHSGNRGQPKIIDATTGLFTDRANPAQVTVFNPTTMQITGLINMEDSENLPNEQILNGFLVRGDEFFCYVRSADTAEPFTSFYVQSANYRTGAFVNTTVIPNAGINAYSNLEGHTNVDEQGNIYYLSTGVAIQGTSCALYKIPAGSNSFDPDYTFNPALAANPLNTLLSNCFFFNYIGNGKAIAYAITDIPQGVLQLVASVGGDPRNLTQAQLLQAQQLFFTENTARWILIDVNTKDVSIISGLPPQGGFVTQSSRVINGEVYLTIKNTDENAIYKYNATSGIAEKAFDVEGGTIRGIYDLSSN